MEATINRIAYKGFNSSRDGRLYCEANSLNRKYYAVGEEAYQDGELKLCNNGIHFCWNINDVHVFYDLHNKVICKIEVLGEIINEPDMTKSCTNKIRVIEILTKEQILSISNTGKDNTGLSNSGDRNSGNGNSGNDNSGNRNSGNRNSGDYNSGDYNSGNSNSGNSNSGNSNSGDYNSGDYNSGDYNSGIFNTSKNPQMYIFDELSVITFVDFYKSKYWEALNSVPFLLDEWVYYTEEEKAADKAKELIGSYLRRYEYKEAWRIYWCKMSDENKEIILSLPNFNKDKFLDITGIEV